MSEPFVDLQGLAERGVGFCREGDWDRGLMMLLRVAELKEKSLELPGLYYSYLGYGLARYQHRLKEGLALCEHAIKVQFFQPENYLNLGRTRMLVDDRKGAVEAIQQGLRIDPTNEALLAFEKKMGKRKPPVLRFLSRDNPINRLLGNLMHDTSGKEPQEKPQPPQRTRRETEPQATTRPNPGDRGRPSS